MSLEKAIIYKKENRKPYRGSAAFDCSCRNHGSCGYCESNRTIFDKKARMRVEGQIDEWFGYHNSCDPHEAIANENDKTYKRMGIDPDDWDTLVELGELCKG